MAFFNVPLPMEQRRSALEVEQVFFQAYARILFTTFPDTSVSRKFSFCPEIYKSSLVWSIGPSVRRMVACKS